ncbi:nitrilase-related carbon-nitrogen hydrolase [Bifidobacterium miconisargentati]|uniref:nitrilase-related carbon-nitrogen hydrolase n=1 Tax=Bifidobacterium miconisargentati TaxID=2834437 RepID=UPI001BDD3636|nr:nitrilase-related carbon-nitrogen hydrolase [Bifidobacterium miconisargentati]MBW3090112.1 acyltransferase [Bifidobacterium miconisargentati]
MTKQTARIVLAQFESELCDPQANIAKALPMIRRAGDAGADMIVFPELFTTGYELSIVGPHITELAESIDGPTITALRAAARDSNLYVVAPIALYHEDLPGVPFNSAVLIDRTGEIAGVYDKQHLWALERFYFRGGNGSPVFKTDFGTVGIMICYDMGYPEVARMLTLKGAQIILCPSAWCEPDHDVWDINVPARALENTVFLCAVNRYGLEKDLYMGGHTKVCNPRGRVIAELPDEAEGTLTIDLNLDEIIAHRQTSPYLRDRRPELYSDMLLP